MTLRAELSRLIAGQVFDDDQTLHLYSADASMFRIKPAVVAYPKDPADIEKLVAFVAGRKKKDGKLSLTPRSAGTDMTGGPLNDSIVVDVSRHLNRIGKIGKDYLVTQPGVFYRDVETETLKHGLLFPSYPASKSIASMAGIVANNSGGEMSLRYGKTENYVRALKVVLSDGHEYSFTKLNQSQLKEKLALKTFEGEVYRRMYALVTKHETVIQNAPPRVSKNSTGYLLWKVWDKTKKTFDLSKIFVGSQGTLGIITEETIGLVPKAKHGKMLVAYLASLDQLADIVNVILKFKPTDLESYDDKTLKLALKFALQLEKLISTDVNIIKFGFDLLPDFWIMLKMLGPPKLVLMAEFDGDSEVEVDTKVTELKAALRPFKLNLHIPRTEEEAQKYWVIRRQSFNLLRKKIVGKQTVPFIDDIIVNPDQMPQFLPKLNAMLDEYPSLLYTIAGHAGDGNYHIIPLMDMTDPEQRAIIPKLAERVYDLVLQYHGSLSAEHNEGLIRGPFIEKMYGPEMFKLFKEVKQIFDPLNIFNPHKKTDASLGYSLKHMKTDNEHSV